MRRPLSVGPLLGLASLFTVLLLGSGCSKEAKFSRHLKRGNEFYAAQQFDRAEIEYLNCISLAPSKGEAIARLGILYYDQGCVTRSIPYLRRARELSPNNLEVRARIGAIQLASGNREEARKEALFILQKDAFNKEAPFLVSDLPTSPKDIEEVRQILSQLPEKAQAGAPVLAARGVLLLKEGKIEQGIALLNQAVSVDPSFDMPHVILSAVFQAQNKVALAEDEARKASELAPVNSSRRTLYAQAKLRQGDVTKAKELLVELTSKNPSLIQPFMVLAEINLVEQKFGDAAKLVAKALARDPINPEALLLQGRIFGAQNEMDKAAASLEKLIKTFPNHGPGSVQLALVYISKNELGKATAVLKQALAINPNSLEAAIVLAELFIRQSDPASAVLLLTDLTKRLPQAPRPRLLLASAYRAQGRMDEAIGILSKLCEQYPKETSYLMQLGALQLQTRNGAAARATFEKAYAVSGASVTALQQIVGLDFSEGKGAESLARVQKLIHDGRKESELYVMLGQIQQTLKNTDAAEEAFREAIRLKPEERSPYFALARLYADGKQTDKALDNLTVVVEKNPKDVGALMLMGMLLEDKQQWNQARDTYEKLLAANPRFAPALNNLAYLYSERFNRGAEAQTLATRARELQPHDPYAADTLGWILFRQGKYAWALSLIKESAEAMPSVGEVQYHLGMTHYMMGEETSARTAFDTALKLGQSFPGLEECKARNALLSIDPLTAGKEMRGLLEKQLSKEPEDPIALAKLAALSAKEGATAASMELYEKILQKNPENLNSLRAMARLSLQAKDASKASNYAKAVRKIVPDDPEMGAVLADVAMGAKDYTYAYNLLVEAQRKLPEDAGIAYALGEAALSQGRLEESRSAWNSGLQLAPAAAQAPAARQKLRFLEALSQPEASPGLLQEAEKQLQQEPDQVAALLFKGHALSAKADKAGATKALESCLSKYPDCVPAIRELALLLVDQPSEAQRAYDLATKAREAMPGDAELAKALGMLCQQRGDYRRAITLLTEANSRSAGDALVFAHLGLAQSKLKPPAPEYKASLEKALSLGLSGELAEQAKAALGKK